MRLKNQQTIALRQEEFVVTRTNGEEKTEIKFLLTALPLGFSEGAEREIPSPSIPTNGYARDHNGKIMKYPNGSPIPALDPQDPEYRKEVAEANLLQSMAMLYKCLAHDPNIEWETVRENCKDNKEFYQGIKKELAESGLSSGEIAEMMNRMLVLSNLAAEEIEKVKEDFLFQES